MSLSSYLQFWRDDPPTQEQKRVLSGLVKELEIEIPYLPERKGAYSDEITRLMGIKFRRRRREWIEGKANKPHR